MKWKIFGILLKHVSHHVSVLFQFGWLYLSSQHEKSYIDDNNSDDVIDGNIDDDNSVTINPGSDNDWLKKQIYGVDIQAHFFARHNLAESCKVNVFSWTIHEREARMLTNHDRNARHITTLATSWWTGYTIGMMGLKLVLFVCFKLVKSSSFVICQIFFLKYWKMRHSKLIN